jgi:hypothetical protein
VKIIQPKEKKLETGVPLFDEIIKGIAGGLVSAFDVVRNGAPETPTTITHHMINEKNRVLRNEK